MAAALSREWVEIGGGKSPFLKLSKKYVPCPIYEGVVKRTRNILYKSLENSSFPPPISTHFLKRQLRLRGIYQHITLIINLFFQSFRIAPKTLLTGYYLIMIQFNGMIKTLSVLQNGHKTEAF